MYVLDCFRVGVFLESYGFLVILLLKMVDLPPVLLCFASKPQVIDIAEVLAEDHSAPVRKEPLVQSPQVGKLDRGHQKVIKYG